MVINTEFIITTHERTSKLGTLHTYNRKKTVVHLRCDSCGNAFQRDKGAMTQSRLSNNFYHVCTDCDAKRFAQEKGVEQRRFWDTPVSSLKQIGHYK